MEIMYEGTVATGKIAFYPSGEILIELSKGSGDSIDSKEFIDPQYEPSANSVDPMDVEGPASSRARLAVNKGKGLASGVQLFRGICKKEAFNHSRHVQLFEEHVRRYCDRLHMFSTFFFMNNVDGRNMFAANVERNEVQLRWLEKQYELNPQFHVL
nr:hypothetical protein CFP56_67162 [Quercus suber]